MELLQAAIDSMPPRVPLLKEFIIWNDCHTWELVVGFDMYILIPRESANLLINWVRSQQDTHETHFCTPFSGTNIYDDHPRAVQLFIEHIKTAKCLDSNLTCEGPELNVYEIEAFDK